MTVVVVKSSMLPIKAIDMWELLLKPTTLQKIGHGFVTYHGDLPQVWEEGQSVDIKPEFTKKPWSLLPPGSHQVTITKIDIARMIIETNEAGGLVKKWNHVMHIIPSSCNEFCVYSDTITIDAGWATPIVKRLANSLYRHRHEQWRHLTAGVTV